MLKVATSYKIEDDIAKRIKTKKSSNAAKIHVIPTKSPVCQVTLGQEYEKELGLTLKIKSSDSTHPIKKGKE